MRRTWVVVLLLVVITAAVYWRVSGHDFVNYDDNDYVTANPRVQAGCTWAGVAWAFRNLHGEKTYWHPLTWLSHMLDCQLFGLRPGPHHLVNLLFHLLNSALLFLILKRMTGAHWRSAAVAALFALHPLQVDSVAWVSERKNVLCGLFWMLAMGAYARYAEKPSPGRYLLVFSCLALGLLAKPVLVTLPCVLLLLDFWPLARKFHPCLEGATGCWGQATVPSPSPSPHPLRRSAVTRMGRGIKGEGQIECETFGLSRPDCATHADGASPRPPRPAFPAAGLPRLLAEKLPLFGLAVASAILTLQAHEGLDMGEARYGVPLGYRIENALVSYSRYLAKTLWPHDLCVLYLHPGVWPGWRVGLATSVLALVTGFVLWNTRRRPYLFVGWFWFLGVLVPAIGLRQVGVQAMADRFAYLPLIGLFIMIVWGVADASANWAGRRVILVGAAGVILAFLTTGTIRQLRYWRNSFSLFERALAVDPANYVAHGNLSVAYAAGGDFQKAREHAEEAVRIRPGFLEGRLELGLLAVLEQKLDEARIHYRNALDQRPDALAAIRRLSEPLTRERRWNEAAAQYALYLELAPDDVAARGDRAVILSLAGRPGEAIAEYHEILRQKPDWPEVLNNLAWLRATSPQPETRDGTEAVRLAEHACNLTQRRQPVYLGTLAAAYAEAGRFAEAIRTAQAAHDLALASGHRDIAETNEKLLELYRANKPYRQEKL